MGAYAGVGAAVVPLAIDTSAIDLTGSGTSVVFSWPNSTVANTVLMLSSIATFFITSITDSAGLTWSMRTRTATAGVGFELWTAKSAGILTGNTVTINFAGSSAYSNKICNNIKGARFASPFDGSAVAANNLAPVLSTTEAATMMFAGVSYDSTAAPTGGSGWTEAPAGGTFHLNEYKIYASPQTNINPALGTGSGDTGKMIIDALVQGP